MRFLADENFPGEVIEALRSLGHGVAWVRTDSPGAPDEDVLKQAASQERLLITFDKDFGEMAFRRAGPRPAGIILFRVALRSPAQVARLAVSALCSRSDWGGHFSVVEETRIRMTLLPSQQKG